MQLPLYSVEDTEAVKGEFHAMWISDSFHNPVEKLFDTARLLKVLPSATSRSALPFKPTVQHDSFPKTPLKSQ